MLHVYIDSPLSTIQDALYRALQSESGVEAHCNSLSECDVAIRDLQSYSPPFPSPFAIPTLALVNRGDDMGMELLRLRYRGVLSNGDNFETLLQALRAVTRGEIWASRQLLTRTFLDSSTPTLTDREQQVLRHLTQGLSNHDIASQLGIAVRTVKSYVSSLLAKHEMHNRIELIVHYNELHSNELHSNDQHVNDQQVDDPSPIDAP